jgi:hypothetical protein
MSNCPTCKESILSQTPSLIGQTQCTQTCPPDITCVDIIPSNCVFYSGPTLSCPSGSTSVNYGVTITEALNTMYQLICQNSTSNTVQITANDTCYGYLASKITSTSLDITITENLGACQKLNIEEGCRTWYNVSTNSSFNGGSFMPFSNWKNYSTRDINFQVAGYSSVKGCSVRLRGTVFNDTYNTSDKIIFTLPAGFTPLKTVRFSVNVQTPSAPQVAVLFSAAYLEINNSGEVILLISNNIAGRYAVSLDGIEIEIN